MLNHIRDQLSGLSPAERQVAEVLLGAPRQFIRRPVNEIAEQAAVSQPTVVRFCRRVGYAGLTDLKRALAAEVSVGLPVVHQAVSASDSTADVVTKIIDNTVGTLLRYRQQAIPHAFERAIELLATAANQGRRIEFYGVGNSGIVAQDAQHKFFRLGVHTTALSDGHVQLMSASILQPGDCVVMISNAGRSRDLLDAADTARKRGAASVAITATGSPLALAAQGAQHVLLAADHSEDHDLYSPMVSRVLHLTIVDILAIGVALRLPPTALDESLQRMKTTLRAKRYVKGPQR